VIFSLCLSLSPIVMQSTVAVTLVAEFDATYHLADIDNPCSGVDWPANSSGVSVFASGADGVNVRADSIQ